MGIPDEFFCLGESAVQAVVGWIATMPIIVMASRPLPGGYGGSPAMALIMSINNLGGIIGTQIGAWLTIYLGVTATNTSTTSGSLVFICNISTLLPLGLIGWVPAQDPHDIIEQRRASTAAADYEADQEP